MKFAGFGALAYWFGMYIKTYYGSYFITNVLMLSPAVYSLIMSVNSVFSFVLAPTLGAFIDSGKQGKWGKYRKFLIYGPILYSICYAATYLPISSNATFLTAWIVIFWSLTTVAGQMILLPYYALHAAIANSPNQRTQFVAKRNFFVNCGSVLFSLTNAAIIGFFTKISGSELWGYSGFVIVAAILNILFFVAEFKAIGPVEAQIALEFPETEKAKGEKAKGPSIKDFFVNIATNLPFALVSIQQLEFGFGASMRSSFYAYYYNAVLVNPTLFSVYMFLNSWMGIFATLALPYIAKKLENTQIAFYAFCIQVVCGIVMKLTLLSSPWIALAFSMLFQFTSIIVGSINASMFQDTAVYAEWKNGADTMATIIGGSQVVGTLASLIVSALYGVILISTGYVAGEPVNDAVANGIVNGIAVYPAIMAAIAAVAAKFNPLTNEKLIQYKKEIDERKGRIAA